MTCPAVPQIEVNRVSRLNLVHERTEIPMRGFQKKMDVIAHQTEQIQPDLILLASLPKAHQQPLTITIILKDSTPINPAYRDSLSAVASGEG